MQHSFFFFLSDIHEIQWLFFFFNRYTGSMSSMRFFPDMQLNQYLESDPILLNGHRDSLNCSNFFDEDWLSSSGNSSEEEAYER